MLSDYWTVEFDANSALWHLVICYVCLPYFMLYTTMSIDFAIVSSSVAKILLQIKYSSKHNQFFLLSTFRSLIETEKTYVDKSKHWWFFLIWNVYQQMNLFIVILIFLVLHMCTVVCVCYSPGSRRLHPLHTNRLRWSRLQQVPGTSLHHETSPLHQL